MFISANARAASALTALGVVAALTWLIVAGLRIDWQAQSAAALIAIRLDPPRPESTKPPPAPPEQSDDRLASPNAPSAGAMQAEAAPVIAPRLPQIVLPSPIAAATQAGNGSAASDGAGGAGSGGGGTGGAGAGASPAQEARQTRGRLKFSDLPIDALEPGKWAEVGVRYTVEADGRVRECAISATSGVAELDTAACRLIVRRFRFRPARDAAGAPVRSTIVETHAWFVKPDNDRS